jgi:acyl carrier protein
MKHYESAEVTRFVDTAKTLLNTNRTLQDIYEMSTTVHGLKTACIYFDEDGKKQSYNYEKYKTRTFFLAERLSTTLSAIPAGSIVALKLRNCPTWPHLFWALLMTGHIPLLIDAKLPYENTDNLLKQSKARAILVNEEKPYSVPSFRLNSITNSEPNYQFSATWENKVIFCSSGTTGAAKMMIMHGENLCYQIAASLNMPKESLLILHPGVTNILAMIPFHHIFGFTAVFLWYTFYGKAIVYPSSMATRDLLSATKEGKVTHLYSVPMFWDGVAQTIQRTAAMKGERMSEFLRNMINFWNGKISGKEAGMAAWPMFRYFMQKKVLGTHIEYCISGGGYLNQKTLNIINGLGYPLYNGFGMTEIGVTSVELSPRVEDRLKGSIGHPFYNVSYKLEPIKGAAEGQGELLVKAPTIHKEEIVNGIYRNVTLDDGYFHTGDIAEMDNTGLYYIKGRIKDVIINSNGENVYPDEIEFYFKNVHHVLNDVVLGIKGPKDQNETITLILELDNSSSPADFPKIKDDVEKINATLSNEKKVQRVLIYKRSMPLANMKVKRYVIRDALLNNKDDFISFDDKEPKNVNKQSFTGFEESLVKETVKKITEIFSKTLLLPVFKIDPAADFVKDLGGDSMSYVSMVEDLNHAFHISIDTDKYGKLLSVNDFTYEILSLNAPKGEKKEEKAQK